MRICEVGLKKKLIPSQNVLNSESRSQLTVTLERPTDSVGVAPDGWAESSMSLGNC